MKKFLFVTMMTVVGLAASADVVSDVRQLLDNKDYNGAVELIQSELEVNPASASDGRLAELWGEALLAMGDAGTATEKFELAKKKGFADASLWLARLSMRRYDFTTAASHYDNYIKLKNKAKKEIDPKAQLERGKIAKLQQALNRVENITVIDSLTVPKEEFFKAYKLHPSAGKLLSPEEMPVVDAQQNAVTGFMNEGGDIILWAQPDTLDNRRIVEAIKLIDGTWSETMYLPEVLNGGGDADYPFMMPDGLTLYFANNGEESLGGYDIFIASKAVDGDFLAPQNLGMPYNSPFDDYLLVIDEQTGVGWWATDRKQIPDSLTLFVYLPNDVRKNLDSEDEEIDVASFARIADIKATQDPEEDYSPYLEAIEANAQREATPPADFAFRLPDGTLLERYNQLRTEREREAMKKYLDSLKIYDNSLKALDGLRKDYHYRGSTATLKMQIADLETSVLNQKKALKKKKNDLILLLAK